MAIHLHSKYDKKIASVFRLNSLVDGRLNDEYSFSGVRTVKISTPVTVPLVDYKRTGTNRYGEPQEMQDTVQELTMSQDKSFSLTVDKGNNADQNGIKSAGRMLALEIKEQVIPMKDKYTFQRLSQLAGTIVGNDTAPTKSTICDRISDGTEALDNQEVPADGRTLYLPASTYKLLKHSDEFLGVEALAGKALAKGQVGEYDNMAVIKVPASRWPEHVNFMIVHRSSATAPSKINDTKLHQDPPGLSGHLMEGRFYYDCFVIGARAGGIYVDVATGSGKGTIVAAPTITPSSGAISSTTGGATIKYTTDGSDPRYSQSAVVGNTASGGAGTLVRAYAYKEGAFPSAVTEATLSA